MTWNIQKIRRALGGRLVGSIFMKTAVCKALLLLPEETIERVTTTVWFISSPEDAWALTFRGSEIKNRHLIFLSDELFQQSEEQISYTILHEIGHVVLNHRNSIGIEQTDTEIKRQESEADRFAIHYLNPRSDTNPAS